MMIGKIGSKFLKNDIDLAIDDDKLLYRSKKFRDEWF